MTALPDPSEFVPHAQFARQSPVLARPAVSEHYWGYEISKRIQVIDLAVLTRAVAGFLTIACFVSAIMVWLVPAMAFTGDVMMGKALASVGMACLGSLMFRFVGRGTRMRVQVDTSVGEIREVVSGMFGSTIVLSNYGLDAIEAVDVAVSRKDPAFGQLHVALKDGPVLPVGDGSVVGLGPLRDKIANDCGLESNAPKRSAIWSGPLAGMAA